MRIWLLVIGVFGVLAVLALLLAGVDVHRLARTGPRWRRMLVAAGLTLIGAAGMTGCDRSSQPTCYKAAPVTCYAPTALTTQPATQPTSQPVTQPAATGPAASQPRQAIPTCYRPAVPQPPKPGAVSSQASPDSQPSPTSHLEDRLRHLERLAQEKAVQPAVLRAIVISLQSDLAEVRDLPGEQRDILLARIQRVEQLANMGSEPDGV